MAALHKKTMNLPSTTDVLTFDLRTNTSAHSVIDLDTVISADVAAREARLRRHPITREILLYSIHSLLHVTGHDDLTPAEAARMHAREDQIFRSLGLPPVYAAPLKRPS
jgi:probable rRNA maturation factor